MLAVVAVHAPASFELDVRWHRWVGALRDTLPNINAVQLYLLSARSRAIGYVIMSANALMMIEVWVE